jgi:hypothetical protein
MATARLRLRRLLLTIPCLFPHYQAVGDFNLDTVQDLAIAFGDGTRGLMEILNGKGDGTFQTPIYYLVPPPFSSIGGGVLAAGDFNNDGKSDIALQVVGASPCLGCALKLDRR